MSLLPLLAACGTGTDTDTGSESHASDGEKTTAGSSGQLDIPADANADLKKQYLLENAIAACMKKQGFTHTPVAPEDPTASWTTDGADYALTKEYRRKYGFGIYAGIAYPDDAGASGSAAARQGSDRTPNADYVDTLTPEQKAAYDKALGAPPDHASSGVGRLACDGEDCQGRAGPEGGRLLRCREANADLLPYLGRRRAEFRQSRHHRLVRK